MNDLPYLVLSSDASVIDASDAARNSLGKLPDKEKLMKSISRTDGIRLADTCASGGIGQSFELRLSHFRAACAVGQPGNVRLLLFGSLSELAANEYVREIRYPDACTPIIRSEEEILTADIPAFLDALCIKMSKKGFHLSQEGISKPPRDRSGSVSLGALSLIASCLVEILSSSSQNEIGVRFSCFSDSFAITFGTDSQIEPGFIGATSDIMCLSSLIPGSALLLSGAESAALESGIRLNCEMTAGGRLELGLYVIPEDEPMLEFKFRDVRKLSLRLLDAADEIISTYR